MKVKMKKSFRRLGLGSLLYWTFYYPKGMIQRSRTRSPLARFGDLLAQKEMERATLQLPPIKSPSLPYALHFLTGEKYWYQTCFCAYSIMSKLSRRLTLTLYDDGSLREANKAEFKRIFQDCVIVGEEEVESALEEKLPVSQFPYLRARRREYPHLRKLTDVHVGGGGWKLVLDSDMLCFRNPEFLLHWLESPDAPCHMRDVETSYGYSPALMEQLAPSVVPEKLNVGICGLKSDDLDWDQLEFWMKRMMEEEGTHYTQEQALVALYCSGKKTSEADPQDYIVLPSKEEVQSPTAVLHHYVADSKPWYFRYGWKQVLPGCSEMRRK